MSQLSEQEIVRREKLSKLRALGINPYPADLFPVTHSSAKVKSEFKEGDKVVLAGRLMRKKIQGKAAFAELQDSEGRVQIYINRDEVCPDEDKSLYNDVFKKLLDLGDFIGVNTTIKLYKATGKLVFEKLSSSTFIIDVSDFSKGLYILELSTSDKVLRSQVVVE